MCRDCARAACLEGVLPPDAGSADADLNSFPGGRDAGGTPACPATGVARLGRGAAMPRAPETTARALGVGLAPPTDASPPGDRPRGGGRPAAKGSTGRSRPPRALDPLLGLAPTAGTDPKRASSNTSDTGRDGSAQASSRPANICPSRELPWDTEEGASSAFPCIKASSGSSLMELEALTAESGGEDRGLDADRSACSDSDLLRLRSSAASGVRTLRGNEEPKDAVWPSTVDGAGGRAG